MLHGTEQPFRTVDLIELTISASNDYVDHLNDNLSCLRLPDIFYESKPLSTSSDHRSRTEFDDSSKLDSNELLLPSPPSSLSDDKLTVSKYVSKLSENGVIDYMFGYEIRYSKNVLAMMKYLAPKLSQPFLIHELDFEVTSFFRYIRWKMLNFYLKHTKRIRMLVERMFGIINLGVSAFAA